MHERRVIIFSGSVQGVGFRATTRSIMRRFVLSGWVRNEPDGSVRLELQGEPAEIEAAIATLREQMSGYIRNETAGQLPLVEKEEGFEIQR